MDNITHSATIHYFHIKGLPPREIHEDMLATLWEDVPSYSMGMKWADKFQQSEKSQDDG